jgi:hypothetical protein
VNDTFLPYISKVGLNVSLLHQGADYLTNPVLNILSREECLSPPYEGTIVSFDGAFFIVELRNVH